MVGDNRRFKKTLQLALKGVIQTRPLNPFHAVRHVPLDNEILFLNVRQALPSLPLHIPQGFMQVLLPTIAVDFHYYSWVP